MKPFYGYRQKTIPASTPKLPAGNYILVIKDAAEINLSDSKSALRIRFDIAEGCYINFFAYRYLSQKSRGRHWEGTLSLAVPSESSCEDEYLSSSFFQSNIRAIEESNPGYCWDWNEEKLKGKLVAGIFYEQEDSGSDIPQAYCHCFCSILAVKNSMALPDTLFLGTQEPIQKQPAGCGYYSGQGIRQPLNRIIGTNQTYAKMTTV